MTNIEKHDILPWDKHESAHEHYTPNPSEIGDEETKKERQEAEELLKYLENISKNQEQKKETTTTQHEWGRAQQAEIFIQQHPDKTNRIIAWGEILKTLHTPQETRIAWRMQKMILKILWPNNR